jgi:hypothetical protein
VQLDGAAMRFRQRDGPVGSDIAPRAAEWSVGANFDHDDVVIAGFSPTAAPG